MERIGRNSIHEPGPSRSWLTADELLKPTFEPVDTTPTRHPGLVRAVDTGRGAHAGCQPASSSTRARPGLLLPATLMVALVLAVAGATGGGTAAQFSAVTSNDGNTFSAAADFGGGGGGCTATVQQVVTDRDASVRQSTPSQNLGTSVLANVDGEAGAVERTLLGFSLPAMPAGCVLSSAYLRLDVNIASGGRTFNVYRLGEAWSETEVTWSNQPATTGSPASGTTLTAGSENSWQQWQVTTLVSELYAGATNHGFVIQDAAEGGSAAWNQYITRESTTAGDRAAPRLVVSFAEAACPTPGAQSVFAIEDSFVKQGTPASNFGTTSPLEVRPLTGQNHRAFFNFALPSVPAGCQAVVAELRLRKFSAFPGRVRVVGNAAAWTEAGVTWANQPGTSGTGVVHNQDSGPLYWDWDVSAETRDLYGASYGLQVRWENEANASDLNTKFYSRETAGTSSDPQLTVTFG